MNLTGINLLRAKTKRSIDQAIFIIKHMIVNNYPKEDMEEPVRRIKKNISENFKWIGEDFCIEKGLELETIWNSYLKYEEQGF